MAVLRRVARWLTWVVIGLVILLAAALAMTTTPWFKDWVRGQIVTRVSPLIDGQLSIGALTGSLWTGVTLDDIVIQHDGVPAVSIGSVQTRYDIRELARGVLAIDDITINRPSIVLREEADGWNLAHLGRSTGSASTSAPPSVTIRRLRVTDGTIDIQPTSGPRRRINDVDFDGGVETGASGVTVAIAHLGAVDADTGLPVTASGQVVAADDVRVRGLTLETPQSHLEIDASYRGGDAPRIETTIDVARLTLAEFAPYLPASVPASLILDGTLAATGPLTALDTSWTLHSTTVGATNGHVVVNATAARPTVDGTISTAALNLAALSRQRDLPARLTMDARVTATIATDDPWQSRVAFDVRTPGLTTFGYTVGALSATGRLDHRVLTARGRAAAYGAAATFDATLHDVTAPAPKLRLDIAGNVQDLDLRRLPATVHAPAMATRLAGAYDVHVMPQVVQASFTADESDVEQAVVAAGTIANVRIEGDRLEASVDGAVHHVSGDLLRLPPEQPVDLGGPIRASVTIPDLSAPFSIDTIAGDVVASLGGSSVHGTTIDRADIDGSIAGGIATIRRLDVAGAGATLTATGTVTVSNTAAGESDLAVEADVPDVSAIPGLPVSDASGAAHLTAHVTGRPDRLSAKGTLAAHQLAYADTARALTFNATFDAALPDRDVHQLSATVDADSAFLTVKGQDIQHLTLHSTYADRRVDVTTRVEQADRALDLEGSLLLRPEFSEVHVRRLSLALDTGTWTLAPGREAVVRYGPDAIEAHDVALTYGTGTIDVEGRVARTAGSTASALRLDLHGLQVADLYAMALGTPRASGTLDGRVDLSGSLADPVAQATMTIRDGRVADVTFSRVTADVGLRQRRVAINAEIDESPGNRFLVTGEVPTAADAGPLDVHVQASDISLALLQAFTSTVDDVTGRVAMDVRVAGALSAPAVIGTLTLADGHARIVPTGVTYDKAAASVRFDGHRALVDRLTLSDDDGHVMTATGGGDLFTAAAGGRSFDLRVQSQAFHVLRNDLGEVEISADAHAEGDIAAPRVTGTISINRGRIELDELLRELSPGTTAPTSPAGSASANGATTPPAGTTANAAAAPATSGPRPVAAGASPAPAPPINVPASVRAPGAPSTPPPVPAQASAETTPAPPADTGLFSRATLDLDVKLPDNVVLRGRNLKTSSGSLGLGNVNLTVGGDFHIRKAAGRSPVIVGEVQTVRGFYEFQSRRFDIVRGSAVTFRGIEPINPSLNVTGERDISGVVARVQVTGTAKRPRLQLSSDPPLDEGDVLSLIVFNQPMSQLGQGEQVDLLQRAGDLALSALATPLANSIGRALDVDLFEIRAPSAGSAGEVNVGRQVSERLFVGFRQEIGDADASRLSFEYRLTDTLRVLTSIAQGADRAKRSRDREAAGVDLQYVLRY
ncbi:MAG TPA: translocation/assembly module TamB domain-containing protein [Vicinamibacterales bacterium]|nr:translocation/assembly module TamB domain-containing protein [Vicinamibacterales bacterium]